MTFPPIFEGVFELFLVGGLWRASNWRAAGARATIGGQFLLRAICACRVPRGAFWGHHTGWGETGAGGCHDYQGRARRLVTAALSLHTYTRARARGPVVGADTRSRPLHTYTRARGASQTEVGKWGLRGVFRQFGKRHS
jgi:hypothetical protein